MSTQTQIASVRRFNRFYTQRIGVLEESLLHSPYSLTEVRVMYELAHRDRPTAAELGRDLGLDRGYLSRMFQKLERQGLLTRERSGDDARRTHLSLTAKGRKVFATLDARQDADVEALLTPLSPVNRSRLVNALDTAAEALGRQVDRTAPVILRPHRPGDMGWVVQRHGAVYWHEYGWNEEFEALVAGICAKFIEQLDPSCERCWIAERNGENVGCIFLVRHTRTTAKLRMLLVEPSARNVGLGKRLIDECIHFAREAGYRKVTLWTNSVLVAARKLYAQAGFQIVKREPIHSFGKSLVSETWDLTL